VCRMTPGPASGVITCEIMMTLTPASLTVLNTALAIPLGTETGWVGGGAECGMRQGPVDEGGARGVGDVEARAVHGNAAGPTRRLL
jgi:hypothetical protein